MAEPQPGRPGGGGTGARSATAATFQVSDTSLRELRRTWQGLTQDVKNFNTELGKLRTHERDIDRLKQKLGSLGGGLGAAVGGAAGGAVGAAAGGRLAGMPPVPSGPVALGMPGMGPPAGYQPNMGNTPAATGRAANGGDSRFSRAQVVGAAIGAYGAAAGYYGKRMGEISDSDLLYNQLGQAQGGGYNEDRRRSEAGRIMVGGGFQSQADMRGGVRAITGALGGTATTGRSAGALRIAQQMTALTPDMGLEGAAGGVASLYSAQSSNRLRTVGSSSVGVGGVTRSPTQVFDDILKQSFRGQPFTAAQITEGMVPGAPLQRTLDYLLPDPNAQQQFQRYALARVNVGAGRGGTGAAGNAATANRAVRAAAGIANGEDVSQADRALVRRTGLDDNIRSKQNRAASQSVRNEEMLTENARGGIMQGFEALADTTEGLTKTFNKLDDVLGNVLSNSAGFGAAAGGPVGTLMNTLGGVGGAAMTYQAVRGAMGARTAGTAVGRAAGGIGRAVGGVGGAIGRGVLGAAAAIGGGTAAVGAGIAAGAGVGVAGIIGAARADRSEGMFSERAWKTAYERGLGELHGYESGYSRGGPVAGNHTRDDVAIKATPGELVVPLSVVGRHGGAKKLMQLLGFSAPPLGGQGDGTSFAKGGEVSGLLPDSALSSIVGGGRLRHDAAAAFNKMVKETGRAIQVTDSYRSYAAQVDVKRRKPTLAAKPGTSNHGWGLALDLGGGIQTFGSEAHEWMRKNAPKYGWVHPAWAQRGGSKPEAWHWEYGPGAGTKVGATTAPGAATTGTTDDVATGGDDPAASLSVAGVGSYASEKEALAAIMGGSAGAGGGGALRALGAAVKSQSSSGTAAPAADVATTGATPDAPSNVGGNAKLGQSKAAARGWTGEEWNSLYQLWQKESGWNHKAANPTSSARGIPQAMMSAHFGKNWKTSAEAKAWMNDPGKQIDWGLDYIGGRYKKPSAAWAHSQKVNWYEKGAWDVLQDEQAQLHAGEMVVPAGQARKLRAMIQQGRRAGLEHGVAPGGVPAQERRVVSLTIQAPVTVVGKATQSDARDFLRMVKHEAETESTLDMIGQG